MPELPEVETVRQTLKKQIINKTITKVDVYYDKILESTNKEEFKTLLIGQKFKDILRYGKYLFFVLDDYIIISHLRMEGKFYLKKINDFISIHEHIVFTLDNDISFRYHDTRKFGKMVLLKTNDFNQALQYPSIKKLGKEANDPTFTKEELYNLIKRKNLHIKQALLNQEIICGIGNIYADEICFLTNLHPLTYTKDLTIDDCEKILNASKIVLEKAIACGGTTIRSYTSSLGVTGLFQQELYVHARDNQLCKICHSKIKKIFVGGRGTYFCPCCQKKNGHLIIGITGSIASGKTTVTNYLKAKGYQIIDADEIVFNEKKINGKIYQLLVEKFQNTILLDNLEIDNQKLSELIFNHPKLKKQIDCLIHPEVYNIIKNLIKKSKEKIIFISVPLLFEAGFDDLCDEIICVYTNYGTQLERLMKRNNLTSIEANNRINSQMKIEKKCQKSDYIIDNSKDLGYTIEQIEKVINQIKEGIK